MEVIIADSNKELAQWAMDHALKNGCRTAKLVLYSNSNVSFELHDARTDKLQQTSEGGFGTSLYIDGRYGPYSTDRLDKRELGTFIKNSIEPIRYLTVDEAHVLPDAPRYYKEGKSDLQLFDKQFSIINPDDKAVVARTAAEEALGKDNRIISVGTSCSDDENAFYRLIGNGFEEEPSSTWLFVSADVAMRGRGEMRPSSYWYESTLFYDKLAKSGAGVRVLEHVLQKFGQRKVAPGKYTMVVDPMNSSDLPNPVLSTLYGSALQQKNSFLLGKLDTKIGAKLLNFMDRPHLIGAGGARYLDSEGMATGPRSVFESGVLKAYSIGTYNPKEMRVEPAVNSPPLLALKPGSKDLNGLVVDVQKGILVIGFNRGNCNNSSGDFPYGTGGFLIENGKLTRPISGMNITDNMITLWVSLAVVGSDARISSS